MFNDFKTTTGYVEVKRAAEDWCLWSAMKEAKELLFTLQQQKTRKRKKEEQEEDGEEQEKQEEEEKREREQECCDQNID